VHSESRAGLVVRQRVAEHPGRQRYMGLGWPTPLCGRMRFPMRSRRSSTRRAPGPVPGSSGRAHEADPHVELGRTDQLGSLTSTAPTMPISHAPELLMSASSGLDDDRGLSACRITSGLIRAQKHQRTRADLIALADRHGCCSPPSGHRASRSTAMSSGASGDAARANTVWIVLTSGLLTGQPCHHGLRKELAAKDHVVLDRCWRPVPILTGGLGASGRRGTPQW